MDDLLLHLRQISLDLLQHASVIASSTHAFLYPPHDSDTQVSSVPVPNLNLTVPSTNELLQPLLDLGAPYNSAKELSQIFCKYSSQLAEQFTQTYQESCSEMATNPKHCVEDYTRLLRSNRHLYSQRVEAWSKELREAVQSRYADNNNTYTSTRLQSKFNYEFTPVLEAVFHDDPSPCRAVKGTLAKKSGMTTRQVDVWFQNRRSRLGKNRRCCTSCPQPVPPANSRLHRRRLIRGRDRCQARISTLCSQSGNVLPDFSKNLSKVLNEASERENVAEIWFGESPPYAYPAAYPPDVREDPFPVRSVGYIELPSPIWRRSPSAWASLVTPQKLSDQDIEEVTVSLARLSLLDDFDQHQEVKVE